MYELNAAIAAQVAGELQPNEKLLWAGQPTAKSGRRSAWPVCLFGIPFLGFSMFWVAMAGGMVWFGGPANAPGFMGVVGMIFPLFGIPFVLVGLGLVSAPYWTVRRARKTWYALTNQRAIVHNGSLFGASEMTSFRGDALGKMSRRSYADGTGDLVFEEGFPGGNQWMTNMPMNRFHRHSQIQRRGFFGIPDVKTVEELVRKTLVKPTDDEGVNRCPD